MNENGQKNIALERKSYFSMSIKADKELINMHILQKSKTNGKEKLIHS
jgi:hypothetical protein